MKIKNIHVLSTLLFINSMGYISGAPVLDQDLDPSRPEIFIEEEVRLLEKDLNGDPYNDQFKRRWNAEKGKYESYISEEDLILLLPIVRHRLYQIPLQDIYSRNMPLIRTEEARAVGQFVGKQAMYYASLRTSNPNVITNAGKIESQTIVDLLREYPLRSGKYVYHCFGKNLEKRVASKIMNGKYGQ